MEHAIKNSDSCVEFFDGPFLPYGGVRSEVIYFDDDGNATPKSKATHYRAHVIGEDDELLASIHFIMPKKEILY